MPRVFEGLSAEAAEGSAESVCNLAWLYDKGLGVHEDRAQALRWYLVAANAGDAKAQSAFQYRPRHAP